MGARHQCGRAGVGALPNGPGMFSLVRSWLKLESGKAAEAACCRAVGRPYRPYKGRPNGTQAR